MSNTEAVFMWLLGGIILLLVIGNLSKKKSCHPVNTVIPSTITASAPGNCSTVGDCMTKGCTIVPGISEPLPPVVTPPVLTTTLLKSGSPMPTKPTCGKPVTFNNTMASCGGIPAHITYPVAPPASYPVPIAIQRPTVPVKVPAKKKPNSCNCCLSDGPCDCTVLRKLYGTDNICGGMECGIACGGGGTGHGRNVL